MKVHRGFQWNCEFQFCPLLFCLGLTQFGQAASTPHHISTASEKNCKTIVLIECASEPGDLFCPLCLHIISGNVCLLWGRERKGKVKRRNEGILAMCVFSVWCCCCSCCCCNQASAAVSFVSCAQKWGDSRRVSAQHLALVLLSFHSFLPLVLLLHF